jgi:hypothetical protein
MVSPKKRSRKASRKRTRRYRVNASVTVQELAKAGSSINLYVHGEREKLGELDIGRGAIYWKGGNKQKWKRISWSRFATMMNHLAYDKAKPSLD